MRDLCLVGDSGGEIAFASRAGLGGSSSGALMGSLQEWWDDICGGYVDCGIGDRRWGSRHLSGSIVEAACVIRGDSLRPGQHSARKRKCDIVDVHAQTKILKKRAALLENSTSSPHLAHGRAERQPPLFDISP